MRIEVVDDALTDDLIRLRGRVERDRGECEQHDRAGHAGPTGNQERDGRGQHRPCGTGAGEAAIGEPTGDRG